MCWFLDPNYPFNLVNFPSRPSLSIPPAHLRPHLVSLVRILPSPSLFSLANDDLAPLCHSRRDPPLCLCRGIPFPHPIAISPCLSLLPTPSFRPFSPLVAAVCRWPDPHGNGPIYARGRWIFVFPESNAVGRLLNSTRLVVTPGSPSLALPHKWCVRSCGGPRPTTTATGYLIPPPPSLFLSLSHSLSLSLSLSLLVFLNPGLG
jgi:hypothetical protein